MSRSRRYLAVAAAAGLGIATITGLGAMPATAAPPPLSVVRTISSAYVGPLQFAVGSHGIYVADSFTSALYKVGRTAPIATGPSAASGGDVPGVAVSGDTIAYTTANASHSDTTLNILRHGHTQVVSLSDFERANNPDKRNYYGLEHLGSVSSACKAELTAQQAQLSYHGAYDSHPYAVASLGHGAWAVADAGANDVLKVDRWGHVSLIAVLPAQPLHITSAMAAALGSADCAGVTYRFEPVPTDVEVGPHGRLFVTTLPGGPEGVSALGARGSVYTVGWGWSHRIATGFNSATNLAISPSGCIYVAELGGGQVAAVLHGHPDVVASLPNVAGLEWAHGHLYASTAPAASGGSGPGTIVELG
jgi:hypothetical protein